MRFLLILVASTLGSQDLHTTCQVPWALSQRVARQEGWWLPNSLVRRTLNPGALVYAGQPGATRGERGFARFRTAQDGWNALERDLRKKLSEGRSLKRAWIYLKDPNPRGLYFE